MADIDPPIELWVAVDEDGDSVRLNECEDDETGAYWELASQSQGDSALIYLDEDDLKRLHETIGKILNEEGKPVAERIEGTAAVKYEA